MGATSCANEASWEMDRKRFWIESVERLSSERVLEKLWFAWGEKISSEVVGYGIECSEVWCRLRKCWSAI